MGKRLLNMPPTGLISKRALNDVKDSDLFDDIVLKRLPHVLRTFVIYSFFNDCRWDPKFLRVMNA